MSPSRPDRNGPPAATIDDEAAPYVERAPVAMVGIGMLGAGNLVVDVNDAFCHLLGKDRAELIGQPFPAIVDPGSRGQRFLDQVYATVEHAESSPHATTVRWLYTKWPAFDPNDPPEGVVVHLRPTSLSSEDLTTANESLLLAGLRQHELREEASQLNEQLNHEVAARSKMARRAQLLSEVGSLLLQLGPSHDWMVERLTHIADELGAETFLCQLLKPEGTVVLGKCDGPMALSPEELHARLCGGDLRTAPVAWSEMGGTWGESGRPHPNVEKTLRAAGATAFASCPLRVGENLLGTVSFVSFTRETFEPNDLQIVQTLGDLLAAGLDRERLLKEAGAAQRAAEQANAAKDQFLAALSHELRTPLNPVLLLATEAAANTAISPELRADFEMIAKNVRLESRLIDDLLDSTRIAHGKLSLQQRPIPVSEVIRDALRQVDEDLHLKRLKLRVEDDGSAPWVLADPMRLQQVFWNVLRNAVKFTPEGGHITVRTSLDPRSERIRVEIVDSGMGMGPEELARIFEAFSQGDHANARSLSNFGGLGLGLAISSHLAEMHEGTIRASSAGPGTGSCFTIELPTTPAPPPAERETSGVAPPRADRGSKGNARLRILLVEDSRPSRILLARLLANRSFDVVSAATMSEGLGLGLSGEYDLLISDIGLPDGNGHELMRQLRHQRGLRGIALSGFGMDTDIEKSTASGFFRHLTKPVAIQTLEDALHAALESPAPAPGTDD